MTTAADIRQPRLTEQKSNFRLDIQGIRAIAVLTVLLYHAGVPWAQGGYVGVDIFFVISGYLITAGIIKEIRNHGSFSFKSFYTRRAARILPAATVTMLGVLVLTALLLPVTRWLQVGKDVIGSAVYVVNWMFAHSSLDYMARDQALSPMQHFWSLAVEEQFYIFWPLAIFLVSTIAWRLGGSRQTGFFVALITIAVPSFVWSIYLTSVDPGAAYLVTTTRAWELCVGAALAIMSGRWGKVSGTLALLVGWSGIAAVATAFLTFNASTPFPGYTALLPVLGTAAIIWAGEYSTSYGPHRVLSFAPMVWVGGLSYSLYLWHWPLLIIGGYVIGKMSWPAGLAIVALSFLPAWVSLKFIEKPFIKFSRNASNQSFGLYAGGLMSLAIVLIGGLLVVQVPASSGPTYKQDVAVGGENASEPVGAEGLLTDAAPSRAVDKFESMTPTALAASEDVLEKTCLKAKGPVDPVACQYGDTNSHKVMVLIGDSHAAMHIPGISRAAKELGFRLDAYTKGSCPLVGSDITLDGKPFSACTQWGKNVTDKVLRTNPTVVLTSTSRYNTAEPAGLSLVDSIPAIAESFSAAWRPFVDANIPVISIRDTPRFDFSVPDCVASNESALSKCSRPISDVLWDAPPEVLAAQSTPGVRSLDMTAAVCLANECPAVIGGVLVYRDNNHLTATYSSSMHTQFATALERMIQK